MWVFLGTTQTYAHYPSLFVTSGLRHMLVVHDRLTLALSSTKAKSDLHGSSIVGYPNMLLWKILDYLTEAVHKHRGLNGIKDY